MTVMPKKGQRLRWKVRYQYAHQGRPYTIACSDEWTAEHKAGEIRRHAELRELEVTVEIIRPTT